MRILRHHIYPFDVEWNLALLKTLTDCEQAKYMGNLESVIAFTMPQYCDGILFYANLKNWITSGTTSTRSMACAYVKTDRLAGVIASAQ